jgi:hypothetical protein
LSLFCSHSIVAVGEAVLDHEGSLVDSQAHGVANEHQRLAFGLAPLVGSWRVQHSAGLRTAATLLRGTVNDTHPKGVVKIVSILGISLYPSIRQQDHGVAFAQ